MAARNSAQTQPGLLLSVEHLHFDYQIKGGDENIRPQRVFDDGSKTCIQMSANVDRLFEHAQLVLGSGKKAPKVEITRDHRG